MKKVPDFDKDKIVMLCIDMQNLYDTGGYEPWQAWQWTQTGQNASKVLFACREKGYPIVHVKVARDVDGVTCHPFDVRDENGKPVYSVKDTKAADFIECMKPFPGELIVEKQRFSAFYQTNLDLILQGYKAEHLIMVGGFTDSCFLTSIYDAFTRGYTTTVIKDGCTAGSEGAHKASMLIIANWIYGGSIITADEMVKALKGEEYKGWFWEMSHSFPFETNNIDELYNQI
jgi:nicotinamidase-related amidase